MKRKEYLYLLNLIIFFYTNEEIFIYITSFNSLIRKQFNYIQCIPGPTIINYLALHIKGWQSDQSTFQTLHIYLMQRGIDLKFFILDNDRLIQISVMFVKHIIMSLSKECVPFRRAWSELSDKVSVILV